MVNWSYISYFSVIQYTGRLKIEVNGINANESGFDIPITYFMHFNLINLVSGFKFGDRSIINEVTYPN
jgi:hypothetical protein